MVEKTGYAFVRTPVPGKPIPGGHGKNCWGGGSSSPVPPAPEGIRAQQSSRIGVYPRLQDIPIGVKSKDAEL